jgi:hypothetical protein
MKEIQKGDIVKPNYDFAKERKQYDYNYPEKDRLLTVCKVVMDSERNRMFFFEELSIPIPLYEACFDLVQDEWEGDEILNEAYRIANKR